MTTPLVAPATSPPPAPAERPTGVTVLAVLAAIGAVFAVLGAIAAFTIGSLGAGEGIGAFAVLGAAAGVFLLVMAAVYAAAAYGLWTRQRWAWYLALVGAALQIVSGVFSLLSLDILSALLALAIGGIVAWYLLSPRVQAWFGVSHNVPWTYSTA